MAARMTLAPVVPLAMAGPAPPANRTVIKAKWRAVLAAGKTRGRCLDGSLVPRRRISCRQSANTRRAHPKGFIGLIRKGQFRPLTWVDPSESSHGTAVRSGGSGTVQAPLAAPSQSDLRFVDL